MAMASAEVGQYSDAVQWQREAIEAGGADGPAGDPEAAAPTTSRRYQAEPALPHAVAGRRAHRVL